MNEIIYYIWLSLKNSTGSADAVKLLKHFPEGAKKIYETEQAELAEISECSSGFINRLADRDLTVAERILEYCFYENIRIIHCLSENYPKKLKDIPNKPIVLYVRGNALSLDDKFCVAIVGTRNMSTYGKHMAFRLARALIAYGAVIVSGAAYGIDSIANNTALFLDEPTVAVLGSGVNVPYPSSNKEMLDKIAVKGLVISEYPPNSPPNARHFPLRNRIISGLSDAVLVIEAAEKSGAIITARYACDQGRRVYAVPGNVGAPNSSGTNSLIRDGAKLVTRAEDIIEDFEEMYDLEKLERVTENEQYIRYEYNSRIPVARENLQIKPEPPKKEAEQKPQDESPKRRVFPKIERKPLKIKPPIEIAPVLPTEVPKGLSEMELAILNKMQSGVAVTADKLSKCGFAADEVLSALTMLELSGAVEALPGGIYIKKI